MDGTFKVLDGIGLDAAVSVSYSSSRLLEDWKFKLVDGSNSILNASGVCVDATQKPGASDPHFKTAKQRIP